MDNKRKQSLISYFLKQANEPSISVKRTKQLNEVQEDNHDDASMSLSSTITTLTTKSNDIDLPPVISQSVQLPSDIKGNEQKDVSDE